MTYFHPLRFALDTVVAVAFGLPLTVPLLWMGRYVRRTTPVVEADPSPLGAGQMGQTSPAQLRRPRTFVRLALRVLCWGGGLLFMASLLPVWTGLGGKCFYNPGTGPYEPPFKMRGHREVTKTNFWSSDAFDDLVAWFDILKHFD
jgi:hypothetical protein